MWYIYMYIYVEYKMHVHAQAHTIFKCCSLSVAEAWNSESLEPEAWRLDPGSWNLEPGAWSPEPGAWITALHPQSPTCGLTHQHRQEKKTHRQKKKTHRQKTKTYRQKTKIHRQKKEILQAIKKDYGSRAQAIRAQAKKRDIRGAQAKKKDTQAKIKDQPKENS